MIRFGTWCLCERFILVMWFEIYCCSVCGFGVGKGIIASLGTLVLYVSFYTLPLKVRRHFKGLRFVP